VELSFLQALSIFGCLPCNCPVSLSSWALHEAALVLQGVKCRRGSLRDSLDLLRLTSRPVQSLDRGRCAPREFLRQTTRSARHGQPVAGSGKVSGPHQGRQDQHPGYGWRGRSHYLGGTGRRQLPERRGGHLPDGDPQAEAWVISLSSLGGGCADRVEIQPRTTGLFGEIRCGLRFPRRCVLRGGAGGQGENP
jgi:hypothetical protein